MEAQSYLISKLEEIKKKFPDISLKYAYDVKTNYHIIEVYPESIRRENIEYLKQESNLWTGFYTQYPNEDLLISKPSKLNNMTNTLFEYNNL